MMHFLLFGFLFIGITQALDYADFGLPNQNSCVFSHDGKVYIINQQSLTISFQQPWDNSSPQITTHNLTTVGACSITRSGRAIFIPSEQQQTLQVIDDITLPWNLNSNITYLGSQNAIDLFIKRTIPLNRLISTAFNDLIVILGANNESSTFILDTRYSLYTWHEISFSTSSPTSVPISTLYATSRWILHFHIDLTKIKIHCFDPLRFQWRGLISTLEINSSNSNQTQQSIQVIPVAADPDSFLIIARQENEVSVTTNLWQSNTSTLLPDITILFLNSIVQKSTTNSSGIGSVLVTRIDDEMVLFYGGKKNLGFLNTSSNAFIETPLWLVTKEAEGHNNHLDIILGTVLGGVAFIIVLIVLFIWFRKRNNVSLSPNNTEAKNMNEEKIEPSPSLSEFTLSPIKRLSPINLFPLPCDYAPSEDEAIIVLPQKQQQPVIKSRFKEHFYYHDSIASSSLQQDND